MTVFIIAEAGVNHNGDVDMALALVDEAARAGADAVKFQTFRADQVASAHALKARYQRETTAGGDDQLAMLRRLELSPQSHHTLAARCRQRGIEFMSTPFDLPSLRLLVEEIGVGRLKIPSGEITNGPMLAAVAATGRPVLLSTGMSTLEEIAEALGVLETVWTTGAPPRPGRPPARPASFAALANRVTLLQCTTEYPAPVDEINLRVLDTLRSIFGLPVGFSDHSEGILIPAAAVACGATVIEKHFTLDRSLPGPDHRASITPGELVGMVADIRTIERALGSAAKTPTASERPNLAVARRSLVAARAIARGELFSADNLTAKRPAGGLSPMRFWDLLGRPAGRAYQPDQAIDGGEPA
ncbi:MAG: N-acetylneuraminate synthase [Rhodospirillaceae bacterium]